MDLSTPEWCYVDFCLVPVGTSTVSVAREVAEVQRLLKASGLSYSMHSAGTTVEGPWTEVMTLVGRAHSLLHSARGGGCQRIQTSMRVGTRTDKIQSIRDKVERVESILAGEE